VIESEDNNIIVETRVDATFLKRNQLRVRVFLPIHHVKTRPRTYAHWSSLSLIAARINARLLDKYRGQTVRLTGKIVQVTGDTAKIQAADGGEVGSSSGDHADPRSAYTSHEQVSTNIALIAGISHIRRLCRDHWQRQG